MPQAYNTVLIFVVNGYFLDLIGTKLAQQITGNHKQYRKNWRKTGAENGLKSLKRQGAPKRPSCCLITILIRLVFLSKNRGFERLLSIVCECEQSTLSGPSPARRNNDSLLSAADVQRVCLRRTHRPVLPLGLMRNSVGKAPVNSPSVADGGQ